MEIVVILVAAAGLSAAGVWWWMSRPDGSRGPSGRGANRLVGFGGAGDDLASDAFVFEPSEDPVIREDRPPPAISVARLAVLITLWTLVVVAAASAIGFVIKLQLDRYFVSGG